MSARTIPLVSLALAALLLIAGCSGATDSGGPATPPTSTPDSSTTSPRLGMVPGLYDQADGSVRAVGVVTRVELEGGFWALTLGELAEGNTSGIVAVIANAEEFETQLQGLLGQTAIVTGTRADGVSVRMAGPEVMAETIEVAR